MTENMKRRVLWMDNQGKDHLRQYRYWLETEGWRVDVSLTIQDALDRLVAAQEGDPHYSVLILDQDVPFSGSGVDGTVPEGPPRIWGGCLVARWLCGLGTPGALPAGFQDGWRKVSDGRTWHSNGHLPPILIVSAYHDERVQEAWVDVRRLMGARFEQVWKPLPLSRFQSAFLGVNGGSV